MSDEHTETGTGWPEPARPSRPSGPAGEPDPRPDAPDPDELSPLSPQSSPAQREADGESPERGAEERSADGAAGRRAAGSSEEPSPTSADPGKGAAAVDPTKSAEAVSGRRVSSAGLMIAVLLALLGFTLVVQLKTTSTDPTLAAARQEDLVRILSDLESRESRLRQDIAALEESQRQLASGAQGRQAALQEATRRADELGILAGTLPATGPGLSIRFEGGAKPITAARVLDAVQELRGAGAEAMQISAGERAVRIVASTYFLDAPGGGLIVDGQRLWGSYTITVIGDPATMRTALNIPGGVVASIKGNGGTVIVDDRATAEVSALHESIELEHARPVS